MADTRLASAAFAIGSLVKALATPSAAEETRQIVKSVLTMLKNVDGLAMRYHSVFPWFDQAVDQGNKSVHD